MCIFANTARLVLQNLTFNIDVVMHAQTHTMQVKDPAETSSPAAHHAHHAPPARRRKRGRAERVLERRLVSALTFLYKEKKKWVKSLLFLTQKGAEECLKFTGGWRVWNLSPRGQTGGFFSFQALIDSPLSSSATQKDTWKNFWCEKQGDLLCRRSLLTLNEHISPPASVSTVGHFNFSPSCMHTGEDFKTLCSFCVYQQHPRLHFKEERWWWTAQQGKTGSEKLKLRPVWFSSFKVMCEPFIVRFYFEGIIFFFLLIFTVIDYSSKASHQSRLCT